MLIAIRSGLYACPERLVSYRVVHQEQHAGTPPTTAGKLNLLRIRGLSVYSDRVRQRDLEE